MSMSIQHINPADATISATTMYKHMRPANVATVNDTRSLPPVSHSFIPGLINISASGLADQDNGWGNDWEMLMGVRRVVPYMDAVVKVFCIHTPPNFSLLWQRNKQSSSNSTGFVIGGRRILTHAHSVDYHTEVKVKKRGSDTKYLATVLAIGTECDIAMLTVSDDEFWEGILWSLEICLHG